MAKKTDFETVSIARRLLVFVPAFYACFFVVSVIALAGAQEPITARGVFTTPFNWRNFTPANGSADLGDCGRDARSRACAGTRALDLHAHSSLAARLSPPARPRPQSPSSPSSSRLSRADRSSSSTLWR